MKKVKLGEVLSLKKGKKATVLAEQTTLSQRYIQIDDNVEKSSKDEIT